ncbi:MAG: hypothetical protein MR550_03045 [Bacilli bacterium]|nr:hypothetical protein [Bacilli bacterium]
MAYYIVIKNNKDYRKIDISSLKEFTRVSRFKNDCYSLEELDLFTSKFNDIIDLKEVLYENNLINNDEILSDISIRIKSNNKLVKVKYDMVYSNSVKFLDTMYLKSVICTLSNDKDYLNKLISYYRNSSCNNENIAKIRWILLGNSDEIDLYNVINDFIIKEIFKTDYNTGEVALKYKSLHDLAMFTYNYINKKEDKKEELLILQSELINKVKKKKRNKQIEGQMSFL